MEALIKLLSSFISITIITITIISIKKQYVMVQNIIKQTQIYFKILYSNVKLIILFFHIWPNMGIKILR